MDEFRAYMEHGELTKFRQFCNSVDESGLVYSMYPRISGPQIGEKKPMACFTFRTKFVEIEPNFEYSYGWAFAVAQEACRHRDIKEIIYKNISYTPETFIKKHPYWAKIEVHQRILNALKVNESAPVAQYHAGQIKMLNDLYRKFKVSASRIFAGTPPEPVVAELAEVVT